MRKFLVKVIMFTAILAVLLAAGEAGVRSLQNIYRQKNDAMTLHGDKVKTLVLGHSQMFYGVNPRIMGDSCYNLAGVSQTLRIDRQLLQLYSRYLVNLKTVIVPVTYTSLFDDRIENTEEWWRMIKYQLYNGLHDHSPLSRYGAEIFYLPGYAGQLGVLLHLTESKLTADALGHGTGYELSRKYPEWRETAVATAMYHTEWLRPELKADNIVEIERLDSISRSMGAELVLVTPPVWYGYSRLIDAARWNETCVTVDSIAHARNILWLDYSSDSRFGDDDFYDSDHLTSDVGAEKFSRILRGDIKKHSK